MKNKTDPPSTKRGSLKATDELDELNAQERRDGDVTRFMEATIETESKKRRSQETPPSSAWKPS
jgi:hypothetical protein